MINDPKVYSSIINSLCPNVLIESAKKSPKSSTNDCTRLFFFCRNHLKIYFLLFIQMYQPNNIFVDEKKHFNQNTVITITATNHNRTIIKLVTMVIIIMGISTMKNVHQERMEMFQMIEMLVPHLVRPPD